MEDIVYNQGILDIAWRFFSTQEYNLLIKLEEEIMIPVFYQLWTLKEAYLKATGTGLSGLQNIPDLTDFIISPQSNVMSRIPFLDGFMAYLECQKYCLALIIKIDNCS
ncbi:MAG: 4'-phosphopantetheinyl transferase superfamily protein [Methanospirillum hungatei]|nr:4'-phosphopantetheinyl transferase superfamily protein [Methanospirillum hungatei]